MPDEHFYLCSGAPPEILAHLLKDERLRWVYAERVENTVLLWRADFIALPVGPENWQHGRAFAEELELAWWLGDAGIDLRCITSGKPPAGVAWQSDLEGETATASSPIALLLMGERDPAVNSEQPAWSTARIPHYFYYPVTAPDSRRVTLIVKYYHLNGIPWEQRLVRVGGGV